MFFGTFDYIILVLIFLVNIVVWKFKIIRKRNWILYLVAFLFFGFVIPLLSVDFEIEKATKDQPIVDNFTLLYNYFRFPVWWFVGILQLLILRKRD
ncbi:hypothetical protein [Chryseobacterium sp. HMWF035]|uniref:hypothetical protein n=1 Tax=Chryseobacterium sp. HMWF035 TaxID=2056868 RepID=UPI000D397617|nr:hypothetical protein [Chryseobacterium sp. HMWF035]PTT71407.1 hypothetical protein DBR25_16665 [Chryseobacterium sp. HMWF001]PVV59560.1 hypothetical protein DD829_05885 [Chryseobacterium sp. HMWF035]